MKQFKRLFPLNLQMFAEDPPADPPKDPEPPATFTQEQLDKIVSDRVSRERKKYEGHDDLKARLEAFEKAEEERKKAEMTEAQRLQAELEVERTKATDYETRLTEAEQRHKQSTINAEFRLLAKEAGVVDAAVALKLVDLAGAGIGEDGAVIGVAEAVEALKASAPYLFAAEKKKPQPLGNEGNPPKNGDKTSEQVLGELAEKARKSGLPADRVAYAEAKAKFNK